MLSLSEGVRIQMKEMVVDWFNDATMLGIYSCEVCPFGAEAHIEPAGSYNWHDPSEQYWNCPVKKRPVWGENPECGSELVRMLFDDADRKAEEKSADTASDTGP